ncbi:L,D-transpeptidase [Pseudaminobacter manganicus]|uniref:L,D-transpeptidase family protein n=1 Tax=Manganibacter manganicus TaxID=1873176 RepID=UPI00178CEF15
MSLFISVFGAALAAVLSGTMAHATLKEEQTNTVGGSSTMSGGQSALLVAQNGDYQIFYDGNGNRVIVDAGTGRVVAVQPPGARRDRRALRRQQMQRGYDDYYLDDPREAARYRRLQMEAERGVIAPPSDSYDPYGYPAESFPPPADDDYFDPYPEQPSAGQPEIAPRSQPIERKPLDEAAIAPPQSQGSIETQPRSADPRLPEGSAKVDPSLSLGTRSDVATLQVLLDRVGASPGVIDGRFGSNVDKALQAYRGLTGTMLRSTDTAAIKEALAKTGGDAFATYTITPQDVAGPYVASIPTDYSVKATLERLGYTSVAEALAERFHMDEGYLKALNPGINFDRPGTIIRVANFGRLVSTQVARIVADKGQKQVRAYDASGKLVAAYPATIGSSDTPSPSGTHAVTRIAFNPNYTYNPKINFKQGENDKVLTIPPGPNGPVGTVWIALDKPTYGIHGTPDPSKIGKTASHGCVRLTNWDATELAKLVKPGVVVEFVD